MILSAKFLFRLLVLLAVSILFTRTSHAQEHVFNSWAAWFNNVKFSERWGMNNDIQFRAGKNWSESSMLLVRPGINYYINPKQTAAAGYAATIVTNQLAHDGHRFTEHRIWQQFIHAGSLGNAAIHHRLRLEQRFLKRPMETEFAQRARYFVRGILPLRQLPGNSFSRGSFVSLQNELFFNIQNKTALNGRFFDQNRAYAAVGYRFSPKHDLEIGYMNQFLLRSNTTSNLMAHIAQLAFYTRL